jgi:hypothetical protein
MQIKSMVAEPVKIQQIATKFEQLENKQKNEL